MSHFSTVELNIKDKELLVYALTEMGFKVEEYDVPVDLLDWVSKVQKGFKANVVVRKSANKNLLSDFGFLLKEGIYLGQVDPWALNSYYSEEYGRGYDAFKRHLKVSYAIELIKRQAEQIRGSRVTCVREEGKTKVRVKLPTNKTRTQISSRGTR